MTEVFIASYVVLWVLATALSVAVFALYHHFGQMYLTSREGRETHGPRPNEPLRRFSGIDISGEPVELPSVGRNAILIFSGVDCPLCTRMLPDVAAFAQAHDELRTIVVTTGPVEAVQQWAGTLHEVATVVADPEYRIAGRFGVGLTPFMVAVDAEGVVRASAVVNDRAGLEQGAGMVSGMPLGADAGVVEIAEATA